MFVAEFDSVFFTTQFVFLLRIRQFFIKKQFSPQKITLNDLCYEGAEQFLRLTFIFTLCNKQ